MKSLLILGAGQFGEVTKEIAEAIGCYDQIGFLDDNKSCAVGKLCQYKEFFGKYSDAVVAMNDFTFRMDYIEKLKITGFHIPVLVHPRAFVAPSAQLNEGTIISAFAAVGSGCVLGKGCIVSMSSIVNHHSHIGDYCHISSGSMVMQNTVVRPCTTTTVGQLYLVEPSLKD